MSSNLPVFTWREIGKHVSPDDAWVVIRGRVYDVSKFASFHPGGKEVLLEYAGKDCTEDFEGLHRNEVLRKYQPRLCVGRVEGVPVEEDDNILDFSHISTVPYAEPGYFQGMKSPYFNESHMRLKKWLREFYAKEVLEEGLASEAAGKVPTMAMYKKLGDAGILATFLGPGEHLKYAPNGLPAGIRPEDFTYFHETLCHEERARMMCPGYEAGISAGLNIATPCLMAYGKDWMKTEVVPELVRGEKVICLAITEAFGGSDVAGLRTRAVLDPTGEYYIVNGTKKWITNGVFSQWFLTAVRTGGNGQGGISLLLIPRTDGVTTTSIKTAYSEAAGTTYITFENVRVPARNLVGKENEGFKLIMSNFNHERWSITAYAIARARYITEECFKWMNQRKAFGKKLTSQPVLIDKLAICIANVEAAYGMHLDNTYQMVMGGPGADKGDDIGGKICLTKLFATRAGTLVATEAVQIFGGRGITRGSSSMGGKVSTFYQAFKFPAVYGGSEEIMSAQAIKLALRRFPKNAKL